MTRSKSALGFPVLPISLPIQIPICYSFHSTETFEVAFIFHSLNP